MHPAPDQQTTVSGVGRDFVEVTTPQGKTYIPIGLVILQSFTPVGTRGAQREVDLQKARTDVAQLKMSVDMYLLRSSARELPTWELLITPDERGMVWLEGFAKPPADPWDHEYEIHPGERGARDYEIRSRGPDGLPGTDDDISSRTIR